MANDVAEALIGERKVATVVFVDIVDSSSIVATGDPEHADELMMPVLGLACDVVESLGGAVAQILGDGVLAVFGAPAAFEDHAEHACAAALEIQKRVGGYSRQIALRVGVCSGDIVLQRGIAGELRCVGEPVHLAARAQQHAAAGEIVVDAAVRDFLKPGAVMRPKGSLRLTADAMPVDVFVLSATSGAAYGDRVRYERSPFVGRASELAALNSAANSALAGEGRTILIHGEAGIGKTRLATTFLKGLDRRRVRAIRIGLAPKPLQSPFDALFRLLSQCMAGGEAVWPTLQVMPGFPQQTSGDSSTRLAKVARWARDTVLTAASAQPLVIVVDDVDRLDSVTAEMLRGLAGKARRAAVLLVLTVRTNTADLDDLPHDQRVRLEALGVKDFRHLARCLLEQGEEGLSARVVNTVCAKAQGNPFFLEECARAIGRLSRSMIFEAVFRPPGSIQTLLSQRIDSLPHTPRAVLLVMSVVGETVDVNVLGRVVEQRPEELMTSLAALAAAGLIFQSRILPRVEFTFHHSLVRDVAYGTLLRRVRWDLHGAVFDALSASSADRRVVRPQLAYHAVSAKRWQEGYAYAVRAAREARRFSRNEEALTLLGMALQCLGQLGSHPKTERRRVDVLRLAATVLFVMGRHLEARTRLAEALQTARRLNDKARSLAVLSDLGLTQWGNGQLTRACASMVLIQRMARRADMLEPWIGASVRLGMLLADLGDLRRAVAVLTEVAGAIPASREFSHFGLLGAPAAAVRAALSAAYSELGDFAAASAWGAEAIDVASRSGHPFSRIYANTYVANGWLVQDQHERAMPLLKEALALCDETGSDVLYPQAAAMLACTWARSGRGREDIKKLFDCVAELDAEGLRSRRPVGAHWMAEAFALTGDDGAAIELVEGALAVSRTGSETGTSARALLVRGTIALRQGAWRDALAFFDEGAALARQCGMAPVEAACLRSRRFAHEQLDAGDAQQLVAAADAGDN